jgi:iron complex transport system substrate-binding protein
MKKSTIVSRSGWHDLPAVAQDRIYEIPSTYILQPGPAALTEGVRLVHEHLARADVS